MLNDDFGGFDKSDLLISSQKSAVMGEVRQTQRDRNTTSNFIIKPELPNLIKNPIAIGELLNKSPFKQYGIIVTIVLYVFYKLIT